MVTAFGTSHVSVRLCPMPSWSFYLITWTESSEYWYVILSLSSVFLAGFVVNPFSISPQIQTPKVEPSIFWLPSASIPIRRPLSLCQTRISVENCGIQSNCMSSSIGSSGKLNLLPTSLWGQALSLSYVMDTVSAISWSTRRTSISTSSKSPSSHTWNTTRRPLTLEMNSLEREKRSSNTTWTFVRKVTGFGSLRQSSPMTWRTLILNFRKAFILSTSACQIR